MHRDSILSDHVGKINTWRPFVPTQVLWVKTWLSVHRDSIVSDEASGTLPWKDQLVIKNSRFRQMVREIDAEQQTTHLSNIEGVRFHKFSLSCLQEAIEDHVAKLYEDILIRDTLFRYRTVATDPSWVSLPVRKFKGTS